MIKTFIFTLIVFPTFIFGQDLKKIKDQDNNEIFYVLKSDNSIKHGEYKKFTISNKLLVKGFYKLGVKDSIWECYDQDGQMTIKYDFKKSELIFYNPNEFFKNKRLRIINNDITDTLLTREPIFLGGDDYILNELVKNVRYPSNAREKGKSGLVYVNFTIDKNGVTSNYHVDKPIGYGLDEEAIRVLKLLPSNWLPGILNEQPVDVEISFPIKFTLR